MRALVDADIMVYRVGFTTQDVDVPIAEARLNELIETTLEAVGATSYNCFLTASKDPTAYRGKIYPQYKQNRKSPKPVHYEALRQYLVDVWKAEVVSTIEADDAIGIASYTNLFHTDEPEKQVIVSIDKDLQQLPGLHYNFVKQEFKEVTEDEGTYFFYKQLLMGDRADNVKGIEGIGEKKADKLLHQGTTEDDWFNIVRQTYYDDHEMYITGEALWILKAPYPKGTFRFHRYGSLLLPEEEIGQSYSLSQTEGTSDVSTQETSTDGERLAGQSLQETTL